jgi:polypeptide N-acetylgalactosaminyltransferase
MCDDLCVDVSGARGPVKLVKCHGLQGNQRWHYSKQSLTIQHVNSNQCLGAPVPSERDAPSIGPCTGHSDQKWLLGDLDWHRNDTS